MRLESLYLRVLAAFSLAGVLVFGVSWLARVPASAPAPAPVRVVVVPPPPAPVPVPVPLEPDAHGVEITVELLDRVARGLKALIEELPPVEIVVPPVPKEVERAVPVVELAPLPKHLTPGRRAALRAILSGDFYLLYFGAPNSPGEDFADGSLDSMRDALRRLNDLGRRWSPQLRYESVGDSVDPGLERFVRDFNLQMLHAQKSGLLTTRALDGQWRVAAHFDDVADDVLFSLLDDPTDATATVRDPETGACELDIGRRDGIARGMRFVLWAQYRPLRRALALAEVDRVEETRCRVRIIRKLSDTWPAAQAIRASNPFFHRGRRVAGIVLGGCHASTSKRIERFPHASVYEKIRFPYFAVVGDVLTEPDVTLTGRRPPRRTVRLRDLDKLGDEAILDRARRGGAILVPERLVRYLLPLK
ncbi:MAG: hypothetical protein ACYTGZ_19350 [Planctomycetota bacterium]|jgi:hypothetical protein